MEKIYLDNAATTFPKPKLVADAVFNYVTNIGSNINRGSYTQALKSEELVFNTREKIATFFGFAESKNVVFTKNITESLNVILKSFLSKGDHVITTSMEHNAVGRPLIQLEETGIEVSYAKCDRYGQIDLKSLVNLIKDNTKAVIVTHASNVCGTILPIKSIGEICKNHAISFIVDSAQTAGVLPIDMMACNIDALAFTGHKGLLGIQGIGGFIVRDEMSNKMSPFISGGTGTMSELSHMPDFLPDKFEAGTQNLPAICSLNSSIDYLNQIGLDAIFKKETSLSDLFISKLSDINEINIIAKSKDVPSVAVVSLDIGVADNAELAEYLDTNYGIMTRCGLHCAPLAHKTLGTFPHGTIRFSFSHYNTEEEVLFAAEKVREFIDLCL
ncbi:MAG: aminotransferase class V-fold PLP-dependent enzyme [Oscillospiraceae bacterium]